MKRNWDLLIASCIVAAAIWFSPHDRWSIAAAAGGTIFRLDQSSGTVSICRPAEEGLRSGAAEGAIFLRCSPAINSELARRAN